jgi:hypothetical protein
VPPGPADAPAVLVLGQRDRTRTGERHSDYTATHYHLRLRPPQSRHTPRTTARRPWPPFILREGPESLACVFTRYKGRSSEGGTRDHAPIQCLYSAYIQRSPADPEPSGLTLAHPPPPTAHCAAMRLYSACTVCYRAVRASGTVPPPWPPSTAPPLLLLLALPLLLPPWPPSTAPPAPSQTAAPPPHARTAPARQQRTATAGWPSPSPSRPRRPRPRVCSRAWRRCRWRHPPHGR